MEFAIGGTAAIGACLFTNPLEVLKTRMQLQGELKARGQHAVHYRNVLHAGYVVASNDGIMALQKGLVPALWLQLTLNGIRLGTFKSLETRGYLLDAQGRPSFVRTMALGGTVGVLAQYLCSPLFMIKTHLQSQAVTAIAVGHQYAHTGLVDAVKMIFTQYGVRGLFRGATACIPRAFVGSTAQLTSFEYFKRQLIEEYPEFFPQRHTLTVFLASMGAGVVCSVAMTPFDLISTRMYNQPVNSKGKGTLYFGYLDCVTKIWKSEGPSAFYKGVGPILLRLGPHTVLTLLFWEKLTALYQNYVKKKVAVVAVE